MSGYSRRCRRVVNEYLESAWPRVHRAFYRCTRSRSTPEERLGCVSTGITPRPRGGSRVKSGHGRNSIGRASISIVSKSFEFFFFLLFFFFFFFYKPVSFVKYLQRKIRLLIIKAQELIIEIYLLIYFIIILIFKNF